MLEYTYSIYVDNTKVASGVATEVLSVFINALLDHYHHERQLQISLEREEPLSLLNDIEARR